MSSREKNEAVENAVANEGCSVTSREREMSLHVQRAYLNAPVYADYGDMTVEDFRFRLCHLFSFDAGAMVDETTGEYTGK